MCQNAAADRAKSVLQAVLLLSGDVMVTGGLTAEVTVLPAAITVDTGTTVTFVVAGGIAAFYQDSPYRCSIAAASQGATIRSTMGVHGQPPGCVYVAGANRSTGPVTDVITVGDVAGKAATATVTVSGSAATPHGCTAGEGGIVSLLALAMVALAWRLGTNSRGRHFLRAGDEADGQ